jgi:hypothetical protein
MGEPRSRRPSQAKQEHLNNSSQSERRARRAVRPNKPIQPTPLCGPEIVGILETEFVPTAVPIYAAARLMGRALGRTMPGFPHSG